MYYLRYAIILLFFLLTLSLLIPTCLMDGKKDFSSGETSSSGPEEIEIEATLPPSPAPEIDYGKLKEIIMEEVKYFPGTAGIAFYDFEREEKIEINEGEIFESASLVKLPVMIEIYRKIEAGELKEEEEIVLKEEDKTGGSGILKDKPSGSLWTVKELVELMITESDNTATDILIDLAGMEEVENTCRKIGLLNTTLERKIYAFEEIDHGKDNLTSPQDMCLLFTKLYEGPEISEMAGKEMLSILKGQKNKKIIPRFLPEDTVCAHKTGGLLGIVHDCGIVYPPDRNPYVLVLMGKNVSDNDLAEEVFAGISEKIYFYLQKGE